MLYLRPSSMPKAGLGLFTDTLIKKGEDIIEYKGKIRTWKECLVEEEKGKGGYFFYVNSRYCIDAFPTPLNLGRYANDARGLSRKTGIRNNSLYEIRGKRVFIVASRNINPGEEIFVFYGEDYWRYFKKH